MKSCSSCLLPETHETIQYDTMGTCNICEQHKYKKEIIDWQAKKIQLDNLIKKYKNNYSYDCIVPFSGGKDSVFTLWYLVKQLKLKCLVVCFDHTFYRPKLIENREKVFKKLGVESIVFTPNWELVKRLMLESLVRKGDFCWHCHNGIFSYPMHIAIKFNVPLVIWGETQAEYTAYYSYKDTEEGNEEVDETRFNRFVNLGISAEDMKNMINMEGIDKRDFEPFIYPKINDLKKINFRSVCLGSYIPWDVKKQVQIIKDELDWQEDLNAGIPPQYGYEKIECQVQGIRDYIRFLKRGYGRTAHLVALDLRNKRLNLEEAQKLINKYDGKRPHSLDQFLKILNITEDEFNEIVKRHAVFPYEPDFSNIKTGQPLHDSNQWPEKNGLDREITEEVLSKFGIK